MLKNYKDLKVWSKSYQLCIDIYNQTKDFPKDEKYGLVSQIRRSAVSIPSNIAEGYGRKTTPDYLRFLYIAYGSICELETQILLSGDLSYMSMNSLKLLLISIAEIERMLMALIKSIERQHVKEGTGDLRTHGGEPSESQIINKSLDPLTPRILES